MRWMSARDRSCNASHAEATALNVTLLHVHCCVPLCVLSSDLLYAGCRATPANMMVLVCLALQRGQTEAMWSTLRRKTNGTTLIIPLNGVVGTLCLARIRYARIHSATPMATCKGRDFKKSSGT